MSRAKNSAYDTKENRGSSSISSSHHHSAGGEFVNHGYDRWNKLRGEWRSSSYGNSNGGNSPVRRRPEPRGVDVDEILDRVFNSRDGNMTLPEPVPLGKMIEILLDVWESDGLYD